MNVHAAPFYCPYCGEEQLEPYGSRGGYLCNSCDRSFELKFLGLAQAQS
ncbi:MAG: DpnI domain-containing protein [Actinomycetota bacterium]|nr:DpnI domain-containing protein [Actinomycetota bacterium]